MSLISQIGLVGTITALVGWAAYRAWRGLYFERYCKKCDEAMEGITPGGHMCPSCGWSARWEWEYRRSEEVRD